jgi:hypothetical protein
MEELAVRKQRAQISEVRLRLQDTDVPSDALPRGESGERLILPTSAKILLRGESLRLEMIAHDPDGWADQYYEELTFDDENPPVIVLDLNKEDILHLTIGGSDYNRHPTAVLAFCDPLEVVESLTLTFASTDSNNAQYAIKALAKMLRDRLGVVVEDSTHQPQQDGYDTPF